METYVKRLSGLDILKILAMLFVVILHVNGYADGYASEDIGIRAVYIITQAIAYPAIHLFVLIGSYLMLERTPTFKSVIHIYLQTLAVTLIGLILLFVFARETVSLKGILQCFFPVVTQSYWFVTQYILLLLLAPFLSFFIGKLSDTHLYALTGLLSVIVVAVPTVFKMFGWSEDSLSLFVFLYFAAASIKRLSAAGKNIKTAGLIVYLVSSGLLILSAFSIEFVGKYLTALQGKGFMFFRYNSIFVVFAALGLFDCFMHVQVDSAKISKRLAFLSSNSLMVYLIHMHPIVKNYYVSWNIVGFLKKSGGGTTCLA